jgi:hypothetical protein
MSLNKSFRGKMCETGGPRKNANLNNPSLDAWG